MRPEPPEPQQNRSRRTHKAILDAALELLATKPFHDVSVTEIVTRAGVSVGAFYSRFASKDSLLDALDAQLSDEFHYSLDQAFPDAEEPVTPGFSPGPGEILARYTSATIRFCRTHREPLLEIQRHSDPASPARSERWRRLHTIAQTRIASRLQKADATLPTGLRLHLALFMIRAASRDAVLRDALRECPVAINDDILVREIARSAVSYLASSP